MEALTVTALTFQLIKFAVYLFLASPAILLVAGLHSLLVDTATGAKLVNRVKVALWKRTKLARQYGNFYTPVEVFIAAGCIGEIPADVMAAHNLARQWGPMPKTGAWYHNPNRLPTCGQL